MTWESGECLPPKWFEDRPDFRWVVPTNPDTGGVPHAVRVIPGMPLMSMGYDAACELFVFVGEDRDPGDPSKRCPACVAVVSRELGC
jgi:hypothetical protein